VTEWVKLFCTVVLISVLTNLFYVQPSIAKPEIITVPDNYLQIQEAINHAYTVVLYFHYQRSLVRASGGYFVSSLF
jgi:hypothetical protein